VFDALDEKHRLATVISVHSLRKDAYYWLLLLPLLLLNGVLVGFERLFYFELGWNNHFTLCTYLCLYASTCTYVWEFLKFTVIRDNGFHAII
jgi:hypothetical protein